MTRRKKIIRSILAAGFALLTYGAVTAGHRFKQFHPGDALPRTTLRNTHGAELTMSALRAK